MANLQSIQARAILTSEMCEEVESVFTSLKRKGETGISATYLPQVLKSLGLDSTVTADTISKSHGLLVSLETLLQIVCQAIDSSPSYFAAVESRELFNQFDSDKDGLLEPFELQRVLNLMGEFAENNEIEKQMSLHDRAHGGQHLSYEDFLVMLQDVKGSTVSSS